jgi:hypothetical protein
MIGSLTLDIQVKDLLPQVLTNPSSAVADIQESMVWNKRVSSELIHCMGTLYISNLELTS